MKIFLIRHGKATIVENDEILTKKGHLEAKSVCMEIEKYPVDEFFSSDLTRSKQTCSYLENHSIKYSSKIREIYRVLIGGNPKEGSSPNRYENDKKRADEFWDHLMNLDTNVAIFMHGNLIKYYLMKSLNIPEAKLFDNLLISNGSITIINKTKNALRVEGINLRSHLPPSDNL